jgi:hypothetical protein
MLFESNDETHENLRGFYAHAAKFHELKRKVKRHEKMQQQKKDQQAKNAAASS